MSGFKNFIMQGNLVELAVAVVIGTQFSNLVKQFVTSFINPLRMSTDTCSDIILTSSPVECSCPRAS